MPTVTILPRKQPQYSHGNTQYYHRKSHNFTRQTATIIPWKYPQYYHAKSHNFTLEIATFLPGNQPEYYHENSHNIIMQTVNFTMETATILPWK